MSTTSGRRLCKSLAASPLLAWGRRIHRDNPNNTHLPGLQKAAASLYCILHDCGDGSFPPVFTDRNALYQSESAYIANDLEPVESSIRSPFCTQAGRAYMNQHKLLDMLKMLRIFDELGVPMGARLLEVGGGTGWLAEVLCIKGYNVVTSTLAGDDHKTALLRSESLKVKRLDTALDALAAPMETIHDSVKDRAPFAVAFCHGALHHAFSWRDTIQSMKKCLGPRGYLLLTDEPSWYHTALCYRSSKIEGRHEVGFFKRDLVRFLRDESFEVLKVQRRLSLSLPLWIVARLK